MSLKTLVLLAPLVFLQGCWFIFIPGSVTSAVSDSITGAEGSNCVGENAKVGDTIRLPGGGRGVIKSLSGTSMRCTNPALPIRALLVFPDDNTQALAPASKTSNVRLTLPAGWEERPLLDSMKTDGIVYALNRTTDTGTYLSVAKREGITDLQAYASTRRANQVSRLSDAQQSEISQVKVNGKTAYRFEVTGTLRSGLKIAYLMTVIDGPTEIAVLNTWTSAANYERQKEAMERLSESVIGF